MEVSEAEWLCGPEAGRVLADLATVDTPTASLVSRLRKTFSPTETHLLLGQTELRQRAARKFENADRLFFTRVGLEQATDQWVAAYKADRFDSVADSAVADLCCGVGGDLMSLAKLEKVIGVDMNPAIAILARANLHASGVDGEVLAAEATAASLPDVDAWHADPDRRPEGRRTLSVDAHSPSTQVLDDLHAVCPSSAIKLAPAATPPEHWQAERELEWISRQGECRQLIVWSGDLAKSAGQRRATAITRAGATSFVGRGDASVEVAGTPLRWICEPDVAVLAAGLDGDLAIANGLARLTNGAAYYTTDVLPATPLIASFDVIDQLPLRTKTIAAYLRERGVGTLEIKHRGVSLDPDKLRRELRLHGDASATLIATSIDRKPVAFVTRRQ